MSAAGRSSGAHQLEKSTPSHAAVWSSAERRRVTTTGQVGDDDADPGRFTTWVAKLTSDGATLWEDFHEGVGCCINGGSGVAASSDAVWAVGHESPQMFETDIFMRQYDPDGVVLATNVIIGVDASAQDLAYDVTLDELGDRIVVGTQRAEAGVDDNDAWVASLRRRGGAVDDDVRWFGAVRRRAGAGWHDRDERSDLRRAKKAGFGIVGWPSWTRTGRRSGNVAFTNHRVRPGTAPR